MLNSSKYHGRSAMTPFVDSPVLQAKSAHIPKSFPSGFDPRSQVPHHAGPLPAGSIDGVQVTHITMYRVSRPWTPGFNPGEAG